jgi:transcriptional regulator with XRE-family HTH domain
MSFGEFMQDMQMNADFGKRLRELRGSTGLTQEEFAQRGGVKRFSQSLYEQGVRLPGLDYLERLQSAGVDVTSLVQHLIRTPKDTISIEVALRAIEAVERSYASNEIDAAYLADRIARFKLLVSFAEGDVGIGESQAQDARRVARS